MQYMTPVILLSDGYIANGSEPWRLPEVEDLKPFPVEFLEEATPGGLPAVLARRAPGAALGQAGHAATSSTASAASRRRT